MIVMCRNLGYKQPRVVFSSFFLHTKSHLLTSSYECWRMLRKYGSLFDSFGVTRCGEGASLKTAIWKYTDLFVELSRVVQPYL